jgi:iron complex outermembrane receptor protein
MDSYSLVNARISWVPSSERWELAAWGRNLGDEEYNRINNRNFLQFDRTIWGAPRTYGVSFNWFSN